MAHWLKITGYPKVQHAFMIHKNLSGDPLQVIGHLTDEELEREDAGTRIFQILDEAYKHLLKYEDLKDFKSVIFESHHERGDSVLEFANKMRSKFLPLARHGDSLSDLRKGQLFLH